MNKYLFFIVILLHFSSYSNAQTPQFRGNSLLELRVVELSTDLSDSPVNLLDYRWELNLYINNELVTESTYFGLDGIGGNSYLTAANAVSYLDGDAADNAVRTQNLPYTFFSEEYSSSFPSAVALNLRVYEKKCRYDVHANATGDDVTYVSNCINNTGSVESASNDVEITNEFTDEFSFEPENVINLPGQWNSIIVNSLSGNFQIKLEWRWTPPVPSETLIQDIKSSYCNEEVYVVKTDNLDYDLPEPSYTAAPYYPNVQYAWYRNTDDERYLSCSNCQWLLDESVAGDPTTGCDVYSLGIDPGDGEIKDKKVQEGISRELALNPSIPVSSSFTIGGGLGKDEGPIGIEPNPDSDCPQTATPPDGRYDCFYWSCDEEMLRKFDYFTTTTSSFLEVTVPQRDTLVNYVYAVKSIVDTGDEIIESVSLSSDATAEIVLELPPAAGMDFSPSAKTEVAEAADTLYDDGGGHLELIHNQTFGAGEGKAILNGFSNLTGNVIVTLIQDRGTAEEFTIGSRTFVSGVGSSSSTPTAALPYMVMPEAITGIESISGGLYANGLPAGNYSLELTTSYEGTELGTATGIKQVCDPTYIDFTILQPATALSITNNDLTWNNGKHLKCNSDNTGRVQVVIDGGVGPYTVLLRSGDGSVEETLTPSATGTYNFTGLPAKFYRVTVTDVFGNTEEVTTTLTQPTVLSLNSVTVGKEAGVPGGSAYDVVCHDGLASITLTASGGNTSANRGRLYSSTGTWLTGGDISTGSITFPNRGAGDYKVLIADSYNYCQTALTDVSITAPEELSTQYTVFAYALNGKNIRCFGAKDARVAARVNSGGVAPYTLEISAPNTTITDNTQTLSAAGVYTFSGLGRYQDDGTTVASYTITITDANNCVDTYSGITFTEPDELVVGSPVKTYLEDPGFSHALYDVPCFDKTVQVTLAVTGGNRDLTVSLRDAATDAIQQQVTLTTGENLASFSNVGAGSYVITVKDALAACGTITTDAFTVTIPDEISYTRWAPLWDDYNISCNGESDGRIHFNVSSGGLAPFTLAATRSSIDYTKEITSAGFGSVQNLAPGTYSISVEDALGCVATKPDITLAQPPTQYLGPTSISPNNAVAGYQITCFGDLSTATIKSVGGNFPHTINLSKNGENYTASSFSVSGDTTFTVFQNLPADNSHAYQVELLAGDAACAATSSFSIRGPTAAITTAVEKLEYTGGVHVKCPGDNTGRIKVSPSGGLAPYQARLYADGVQIATTSIADAGNATFSGLLATQAGANIAYSIAIEDKLGCIDSVTQIAGEAITLTEPEPITFTTTLPATIEGYHLYCETSTGNIQVQTDGGIYFHAIRYFDADSNFLAYRRSDSPTDIRGLGGLSAGTYYIKVNDVLNGETCAVWDTVELLQPDPLTISVDTIIAPSCLGSDDGQVHLSAKDGIPFSGSEYTFTLTRLGTASPVDSGTGSTVILSAAAGNYVVKVFDQGSCVDQDTISITDRAPLYAYFQASGTANPSCYDKADGKLFAYGADGTPTSAGSYSWRLYSDAEKTLQIGSRFNYRAFFNTLAAGTYYLEIEDSLGCTYTIDTTLVDPNPVSIDLISLDRPTCHEGSDAQITVRGAGGTGSFFYSDDNSTFTTVATTGSYQRKDLPAGTYAIYLRDTNYDPTTPEYCFAADTFTIQDRGPIELSLDVQEVTCYDDRDGQVTVTVVQEGSSIAGRIAYEWYQGLTLTSTDQNLTGADAGTYHLLLTDTTNGCTAASDTVTILQPAALSLGASRSFPTTCSSDDDGKIIVSATGGSPAYTYWLNDTLSNNLQLFTGLPAALHQVTVVDARGCSDTVFVEVEKGTLNLVADSVSDVTCHGATDGYVRLNVTNEGGAGYEYSADNGTSWQGASVFRLGAGTYQFLARETYDDPCYSEVLTIEIQEPDPLSVTAALVQDAACGQSDGQASMTASGGSGNYTITWYDADLQIADPDALPAGTYVVELSDNEASLACLAYDTVVIADLPAPVLAYAETATPWCGQALGAINLSASSGTGAYTYQLQGRDPQTSTSIDSLFGGVTYTATVTDERGCQDQLSFSLSDGPALEVTTLSVTDANCSLSDGSLEISTTGGVGPYSYAWPDSVSTDDTAILNGLASGLYTVTVTDAVGCTASHQVAVSDLNGPELSLSSTQSWCSLPTGTAEAIVTGGTGTITYAWSGPEGFSSPLASIDSLATGTYGLVIEDDNNCQVVATVDITEDTSLTPALSLLSDRLSACGLALGRAEVAMTGGDAPYTYAWYDADDQPVSASDGLAENLLAGDYHVIAQDAKGCEQSLDLSIGEVADPVLSFVSKSTATCGGANATAEVSASGGAGAYTYLWNDGNAQTTAFAENLAAGTYTVFASDANGCQTNSLSVTILADPVLLVEANQITAAGCAGAADGTATIIASGGTAPYSYAWDDPLAQTMATASGLDAGDYTITVTDAKGCTEMLTVTVPERAALAVSETYSSFPACYGDANGSLGILASGGTGAYTYTWSTGATGEQVNSIAAGDYTVTITDANTGCSIEQALSLTQPTVLQIASTQATQPACEGDCNGSLNVSATGGTGAYTYAWTSGSTSATASGLCAGDYSVTITDANNCMVSTDLSLSDPAAISLNAWSTTLPDCSDDCNGSMSITVDNATSPVLFLWDNGAFGSRANNLCAGEYQVAVLDANGCEASFSNTLPAYPALQINDISTTDISCSDYCDGSITVAASGGNGSLSYRWSHGATGASLSNLCAGTYTVTIRDQSGCSIRQSITLTEPQALRLSTLERQDPACAFGSDGLIEMAASGGTGTLSYAWAHGATGARITDLTAGYYTATVTDQNGCSAIKSLNLSNPLQVIATATLDYPDCATSCDGSISLSPRGGIGTYTYLWEDGATDAARTDLCQGIYTVTISDENGCSFDLSRELISPDRLQIIDIDLIDPACAGDCNGEIALIANGGTAPYTYDWEHGATGAIATSLCAGEYAVLLTDAAGCTDSARVSLIAPDPVVLTGIESAYTICEGEILRIDAGTWGSYQWSETAIGFSSINREAAIRAAGDYALSVQSFDGCAASTTFTVEVTADPFDAEFLMASESEVGDTVEVIDVTLPEPEVIAWDLPDGVTRIDGGEDRIFLIFNEPGDYTIGFTGSSGDCSTYLEKAITIHEAGTLTEGTATSPGAPDELLDLTAFPNPSKGIVSVRVELDSPGDITLEVLDLIQGRQITRQQDEGDYYYRKEFDLSTLPAGVYMLRLSAKGQQKVIRITKQ